MNPSDLIARCGGALCAVWMALVALPAHAGGTDNAQVQQAAQAFYAQYRQLGFTGLPDAQQQRRLAPHLSPGLARTLAAARTEQQRCARLHPDDKPPWIEGDLFTSTFEGHQSAQAGEVTGQAAQREVVMSFTYEDRGQTVRWQDVALMVRHRGRWVLDDVRYQGGFEFGNPSGSRLRAGLAERPAC